MDAQKTTPLREIQRLAEASWVNFHGWSLPLHYGSALQEHQAVRQAVGLFDVSHMGLLDVTGAGAKDFLRYVLANDVARLKQPGRALYTCLLNDAAGIVDDLIVYYLAEGHYRLVLNASRRQIDFNHLNAHVRDFAVTLTERTDLCLLAVQGPGASVVLQNFLPESAAIVATLPTFGVCTIDDYCIARTGYTGEDGFEIMCSISHVCSCWQALCALGAVPCGLAARDSLRLEAGFNLYGQDMDATQTPASSNLAWTVCERLRRDFIGQRAWRAIDKKNTPQLLGLYYQGGAQLRAKQVVVTPKGEGIITSGGYSPTLGCSVALARIPRQSISTVQVARRGIFLTVPCVSPPFVRAGRTVIMTGGNHEPVP